mmetsp:Transcript_143187/g.248168  ORF Transcript_143187/g.248168 Transcript_143187/m.248168 type:complete len:90 (-) Transcript_143187:8-277(-)
MSTFSNFEVLLTAKLVFAETCTSSACAYSAHCLSKWSCTLQLSSCTSGSYFTSLCSQFALLAKTDGHFAGELMHPGHLRYKLVLTVCIA